MFKVYAFLQNHRAIELITNYYGIHQLCTVYTIYLNTASYQEKHYYFNI